MSDELPNDERSSHSAPASRTSSRWAGAYVVIAIWTAASAALASARVDIAQGCMQPLVGLAKILFLFSPLLLLAVVGSFLTARRFPQATRRVQTGIMLCAAAVSSIAAWLAVWNAGFYLRGSTRPELSTRLAENSLPVAAGLLLSILLFRLLRAYGARRCGWYALGVSAAALIALGLVAPGASEQLRERHVRPLVDYISTHWVRIPAGSSMTVQHRRGSVSNEHTDLLEIVTPDAHWEVWARHRVGEGWAFPGGSGAHSVLFGYTHIRTGIHSEAQALSHLRALIVDRRASPARLSVPPEGSSWYAIPSSLAGGRFRVEHSGAVQLYLRRPLVVPAR